MKYSIILIALLSSFLSIQAQNVAYESLDGWSKVISEYQLESNNLTYQADNTKYEVSFAETSFRVAFHNQLATQAVYRKSNGKEVLSLTENIDLSKVTSIMQGVLSPELASIKLYFKSGVTVNTQLIENGQVMGTVSNNYVELITPYNQSASAVMFKLFDLCSAMQIAKGIISKEEVAQQKKDWGKSMETYIAKYPNSLFTMQAKQILRIRAMEKAEYDKLAAVKAGAFMDSLSDVYHIRVGMSEADFAKRNPEVAALYFTKKNTHVSDGGNQREFYKLFGKKIPSPVRWVAFSYDKLTKFTYCHYFYSDTERMRKYNAMLELAKKNVPAEYIQIFSHYFVLTHPVEKFWLYFEYHAMTDASEKAITLEVKFLKRT